MTRLISDSSSNVYNIDENYKTVPLKVITVNKEYVDTGVSEVGEMNEFLRTNKEKISTSCPNAYEWLEAFSKEEDNICFTISSNLSGSYNACKQAKEIYEEENKHKVVIIDSLSAGPELELLIEKTIELIKKGKSTDEIEKCLLDYQDTTHTYFVTSSVKNLVNAGRIPSLVGKAINVLKITLVGLGSDEGKIKIVHESRTAKKALNYVYEKMKERGYKGGKLRISDCFNADLAMNLINKAKEDFASADALNRACGILCSYYVEEGGIIVAFEGNKE